MGNIHAMAHRMKAVSIACLASIALIFGVLAGIQCNFLEIQAERGRTLQDGNGVELFGQAYNGTLTTQSAVTELSVGVTCDHEDNPMFEDDDSMRTMSRWFFYVGNVALASIATLLAWLLSTCIPPTTATWRCLSIVAAATAVLEVPVFILFESEPCIRDINRQTCTLDIGSYFNIVSILLWVILTLITQCMHPPKWQEELQAWVNNNDDNDNDNAIGTDDSFDKSIPSIINTRSSSSATNVVDTSNSEDKDEDVELQIRPRWLRSKSGTKQRQQQTEPDGAAENHADARIDARMADEEEQPKQLSKRELKRQQREQQKLKQQEERQQKLLLQEQQLELKRQKEMEQEKQKQEQKRLREAAAAAQAASQIKVRVQAEPSMFQFSHRNVAPQAAPATISDPQVKQAPKAAAKAEAPMTNTRPAMAPAYGRETLTTQQSKVYPHSVAPTKHTLNSLDTWQDFAENKAQSDLVLFACNFDDGISELGSSDNTARIIETPQKPKSSVLCGDDDAIRRGAAAVMDALRGATDSTGNEDPKRHRRTKHAKIRAVTSSSLDGAEGNFGFIPGCVNDALPGCFPAMDEIDHAVVSAPPITRHGVPTRSITIPNPDVRASNQKHGDSRPSYTQQSRASPIVSESISNADAVIDDRTKESHMLETAVILQDLEAPMVIEPTPRILRM